MPRPNLLGLLDDAARWGERPALVERKGVRAARWSYARLRRAGFQAARELDARGVRSGDRVIIRAGNGAGWAAAFWGCLLRRAIVVPLDPDSTPDLVRRVATQVEPRLHLDGPGLEAFAEAAAAREATPVPIGEIGRRDLAEIVFTSGTTSEPKGVCLTHGNLLANLEPVEAEVGKHPLLQRLARPMRFLCPLPLTHVFGQIASLLAPPLLGAEVVFPPSLKATDLADTARRHRVTVMVAVPRQLEILREHVERSVGARRGEAFAPAFASAEGKPFFARWWAFRDVHRLFGWRLLVLATGGATLDRETELFWRRLGFVVVQGYGMTETAALVTLNSPFDSTAGSIGKPLPGQEVKVDAGGQVLVRGEAVSPGYWKGGPQPLTDAEGWLATGDVVLRDASGALFFRGRSKDVIVTAAGLSVYPEDLEAALHRQPEVKAATVVGLEGGHGPEPVAVLVMKDGSERAADVVAKANATLGPHQQMRRWLVWPGPDFPRTASTQKVKKAEVAAVAQARLAGAGTGPVPAGPLAVLIGAAGGEVPAELGQGARLGADLKLDSLGQVELLAALEERYQVDIDEAAFTPATTVGDVQRMLGGGPLEPGPPYPYPDWARRPPITWIRPLLYGLVALPITRLMCWVRTGGRERMRGLAGPALFVSNHVTMVDHALILSALPWAFRRRLSIAMEGERLRRWRHPPPEAGWLPRIFSPALYLLVVAVFNVFSLPKKSGFRRSFAFAGESADRGFSLLVFPEGRRTEDGAMNPFLPGIGLLASQLGLPVVPIRIDGLFELKKENRYLSWPGRVAVTFGEPVRYAREDPAAITKDLERRVAAIAS